MIVSNDYGQAQFSGTLTTMTAAKSINAALLNIPGRATHWVAYNTGATAAIVDNEILTGGTSSHTCRLEKKVLDNGTAGAGDSGILFIRDQSALLHAETLTGTSTGTVVIAQVPIVISSYTQPKSLLISVETASVNVCFDGTTPTATAGTNLGHTLTAGQTLLITGIDSIRNFKVINAVNGSGSIVKYSLYF
jgi:hypothetical protein